MQNLHFVLFSENNVKIKNVASESTCKICKSTASLFGVTDFNTSCYGQNVHRYNYPLSGYAIYYHKCNSCDLIFTNAFDDWSDGDYQQYIYNDEYIKYDPNFNESRSKKNAQLLLTNIKGLSGFKMLDFGCGDGQLVNKLKAKGINVRGWDPFHNNEPMPATTFDFITSFEVMEHTPDPIKTMSLIDELMPEKTGKYFFSTTVNDAHIDKLMNNWYIAPRNGHITIYSKKSLDILFEKFGMKVIHFSESYHIAYKVV